ncbi:scavenger receptor cysteine-rich domain-containing protein DMBT1-like [Rhinoraja longicauda]
MKPLMGRFFLIGALEQTAVHALLRSKPIGCLERNISYYENSYQRINPQIHLNVKFHPREFSSVTDQSTRKTRALCTAIQKAIINLNSSEAALGMVRRTLQVTSLNFQCVKSAATDRLLLKTFNATCEVTAVCRRKTVKLRLVNGGSPCAGRVEVYYERNWGTVYDEGWDLQDAAVVCRELGCGAAVGAPGGAHFGQWFGPVVIVRVRCNGSEAALRECESAEWGPTGLTNSNDAGVICEDHKMPRLVSGDDPCMGRLEVVYGDTWGTVCDLHWDRNDAKVVCNQLQCRHALSVPGAAYFGEGTGLVRNEVFGCQGNESSLWHCPRSSGTRHCNHGNDVGVICSGNHGPRLVGGKNRCSGRVEVLHGDKWGTVCDQYFSLDAAGVVCEHLQCGAVAATPGGAHFGQGTGPVWKENYRCRGNESRLADCPVSAWDQISCSHRNDASLICSDESWSVRLSNGGSRCDGRVEVYHNGRWGRVHDRSWNINDSNVVCRELGCGSAIFAYNSSRYGESELPVWVTDVQCEGDEARLRNCSTFTMNPFPTDSIGVGVLCSDHRRLRLTGGGSACAGRLELYYHGSWGTVCDDLWDLLDDNVVCRQLGCGYALEDKPLGYCGGSRGPIWLDDVRCSGNESYLWECPSAPLGEHDCSHKEDVTVKCSEHKEMRLVNGKHRCEGRVEVRYNGTWGTVCSEKLYGKDAEVICKQVKCGPLKSFYVDVAKYGAGTGPIWLDEMDCNSHEATLWQCQSDPWGKHNCRHMEDAGVECEDAEMPEGSSGKACDGGNESQSRRLPELPLRLDGGSNNCSGRVRLLFNSSWGTVCDDSWDLADANVVCRQLGCGAASWSPGAVSIAPVSGEIWLDEVKCTGAELFLSSCLSSPLGQHDCDHKEDVIVICSDPVLTPTGSSISVLGNKMPSMIVVACITLGILLIGELLALMLITRRRAAKRGAGISGRGSPIGFYQAIYEEIEDTPAGKSFSQTHDSDSGSNESISHLEYYTSVPLDGSLLAQECPEGNSSSVRDLVPDAHDDAESETIASPGCQFRIGAGDDDLLKITAAGGDVDNDERTSQIVTDPAFPPAGSTNSNDKLHCGTFTVPALAAPIGVDGSFPSFTSEP